MGTEIVSFRGIIRGNGLEATCIVGGEELVHASGLRALSKLSSIESVTPELPEGEYTLTFNGRSDRVRYKDIGYGMREWMWV
jgi:hypothetical protein